MTEDYQQQERRSRIRYGVPELRSSRNAGQELGMVSPELVSPELAELRSSRNAGQELGMVSPELACTSSEGLGMVGRWGHPHNLLCVLTASAHKPSVKTSTGDAGQLSAQASGVWFVLRTMGGLF